MLKYLFRSKENFNFLSRIEYLYVPKIQVFRHGDNLNFIYQSSDFILRYRSLF